MKARDKFCETCRFHDTKLHIKLEDGRWIYYTDHLAALEAAMKEKEDQVRHLHTTISTLKGNIAFFKTENEVKQSQLQAIIETQAEQIAALRELGKKAGEEIRHLRACIRDRASDKAQIAALKDRIHNLSDYSEGYHEQEQQIAALKVKLSKWEASSLCSKRIDADTTGRQWLIEQEGKDG